jgi:hypothetical protein
MVFSWILCYCFHVNISLQTTLSSTKLFIHVFRCTRWPLTISSVFKPWFTAPDQWGGRYRWRITTSWYARNMYWCTHLVCSIFYAQISDIAMQFRPNVLQGQKANSYFSSTSLMPIDFRTKFKVDTYQFVHVNFWISVLIRSFKSGYYLCLFTVAHLVLHHTYLLTLTKWDCHFAPSPHYPKS